MNKSTKWVSHFDDAFWRDYDFDPEWGRWVMGITLWLSYHDSYLDSLLVSSSETIGNYDLLYLSVYGVMRQRQRKDSALLAALNSFGLQRRGCPTGGWIWYMYDLDSDF